jgi:hypothetical protein
MGTAREEEKNHFASAGVQGVRWRGWRRMCGWRDRGRLLENGERRRWPRSSGYLSECVRAVREVGRVGQADSAEDVYYSHGLGPLAFFFILSIFFKLQNRFKLTKFETSTFKAPKTSKLCMVSAYVKLDNFHFWPNSQIPLYFELKSRKQIQFDVGLNFKGVQTFEEKFHNFPKKTFLT